MSLRSVALVAIAIAALSGAACGGSSDNVALTAESVVATAIVASEPTSVPTETPASDAPIVKIPHRGYNALGDPNAPIKLFDFSDFL